LLIAAISPIETVRTPPNVTWEMGQADLNPQAYR